MNRVSKDDEIEQLERRLDLRRERLRRHYHATRADFLDKGRSIARTAGKAMGWAPYALIGGGLLVGFAISRYPRQPAPIPMQPVMAYGAVPARPRTSRNALAALIGIAATAMRFASSREVHTLWRGIRTLRDRRRR
jgi:hypothetical protein